MYDPSIDDCLFWVLELRHRTQYQDLERAFLAASVDKDTRVVERAELIDDVTAAMDQKDADGPMILQFLDAQVTPFPTDVVLAGIQQFAIQRSCVSEQARIGECSCMQLLLSRSDSLVVPAFV